ncbi:MAG: HEAT repeat domain-containing protein [Phycisphaerae bacterium]
MRRRAILPLLPLLLAIAASPLAAADANPDDLIKQMTGEAEALKRSAAEWQAAYRTVLNHLLPAMGSENANERGEAQRRFEDVALAAGRPGADVRREALGTVMAEALGKTDNVEARVWLLRQLQYIGGAEAVPALVKAMASDNARVAECARRALQRNDSDAAVDALRDALAKATKADAQVALINAVADRRDAKAVALIARHLTASNPDVARAAAAGLGSIGTEAAADALQKARKAARGEVRTVVLDSLLRCGGHLLDAGKADAAYAVYASLNEKALPGRVRMGAIRGMALARPTQAPDLLTRVMTGPNPALRRYALTQVSEAPGGEATTRAFAAMLPKLAPDEQEALVRELADRGDPAAKPAVLRAVGSETEAVRAAAVAAMGKLGGPDDVVRLAQMAAKAEGDVKKAALQSLVRLRGKGVDAAMIEALGKVQPGARAELIAALADRQADGVAGRLAAYLDDPDTGVRVATAQALGRIGGCQTIGPLAGVVAGEDGKARGAAAKAIQSLCDRNKDKAACAKALVGAIERAPAGAKPHLIAALPRTGTDTALDAARSALGSGEAGVREAAIRALADWPTAAPVDDLLGLVKTAEKDAHKILALRGYVRLVAMAECSEDRKAEMYKQAMAAAKRAQEKRMVLSALTEAPSPVTLDLARSQMAEADLKDEAALAVAKIAHAIVSGYPNDAREAAEAVLAQSKNQTARQEAQKALNVLTRFEDYITAWMMTGPYTKGDAFKTAYPPEKDGAKVDWKIYRPTNKDQPWRVDLGKIYGGSNRAAYLRTYLHADAKKDVRLEIGTDDGCKVWLNGKRIHEVNTSRGLTVGQDKIKATLRKGSNELLLKVVNEGGGWEACARVRAPDGAKAEGVTARPRE